jgi:hypothetical protein
VVTLQEQISRSLLQPRGGHGNSSGVFSNLSPQEATVGLTKCVSATVLETANTQLCPTPFPIIHKTRVAGPPYPMFTSGNRGYAVSAFWATGTAFFMQSPEGQIIAMKKDGGVRIYRPRKHIVVSSNPRVKNLVRARDRIDHLSKRLRGAIGARALSSGRGKKR